MKADLKSLTDACESCLTHKPSLPSDPIKSDFPANFPMHAVSIDLFEADNKMFLAMIDRFSGFIFVERLSSITTAAVLKALDRWFLDHGFPAHLRSDAGTNLVSSEFEQYCKDNFIEHSTSSPHFHRSNGLAEAAVKIAKNLYLKCNCNLADFKKALLVYRNTPRAHQKFSPAELFYGRPLRDGLPVFRPDDVPNASGSPPDRHKRLNIGDKVVVQHAISKKWLEKGTVVGIRAHERSYLVRLDTGRILVRNRKFIRPIASSTTQIENPQRSATKSNLRPNVAPDSDESNNKLPRRSPRLRDRKGANMAKSCKTNVLRKRVHTLTEDFHAAGDLKRKRTARVVTFGRDDFISFDHRDPPADILNSH